MTCRNMKSDLEEMLLTPEKASQATRDHLAACENCRRELAEMQATFALLDEWQAPEVNAWFPVRMQALLREGVSIRDLGAIIEAIGDKARLTRDPGVLAEYARQALGRSQDLLLKLRHNALDSEHLLLILLGQREGLVPLAFKHLDASPAPALDRPQRDVLIRRTRRPEQDG